MDKAGYASELVAYRVIDKLAGTIAGDVREALGRDTGARVLVVDDLERFAGGMALAEIKSQVELLKGVFDKREADHAGLLKDAGTPGAFTASPPAPEAMHHLFDPATLRAALAGVSWESIPKVVDAVAGFLGYFGSNYKVTDREMSVAKQALLASTAGSLAATSGPDVFLPNFHVAGASPLLGELRN